MRKGNVKSSEMERQKEETRREKGRKGPKNRKRR